MRFARVSSSAVPRSGGRARFRFIERGGDEDVEEGLELDFVWLWKRSGWWRLISQFSFFFFSFFVEDQECGGLAKF